MSKRLSELGDAVSGTTTNVSLEALAGSGQTNIRFPDDFWSTINGINGEDLPVEDTTYIYTLDETGVGQYTHSKVLTVSNVTWTAGGDNSIATVSGSGYNAEVSWSLDPGVTKDTTAWVKATFSPEVVTWLGLSQNYVQKNVQVNSS